MRTLLASAWPSGRRPRSPGRVGTTISKEFRLPGSEPPFQSHYVIINFSSIWEGSLELMKSLNSSLQSLPEIEWRKNLASSTSWALSFITNHSQLINQLVEYQSKVERLFSSVSCSIQAKNQQGKQLEIITVPFVLVSREYRCVFLTIEKWSKYRDGDRQRHFHSDKICREWA